MDGYCFVYVFPCAWEDHCKIGFSRDPLSRISALHRRWFEFFDLGRGMLVETETVRDARDLELELRRPLALHNAPAPLAVSREAAGHTEWFRGAGASLERLAGVMVLRGHTVHAPLHAWMRVALLQRSDRLYAWAQAQRDALESGMCERPAQLQRILGDALDAHTVLGVALDPLLSPEVSIWYRDMWRMNRRG